MALKFFDVKAWPLNKGSTFRGSNKTLFMLPSFIYRLVPKIQRTCALSQPHPFCEWNASIRLKAKYVHAIVHIAKSERCAGEMEQSWSRKCQKG